MRYHGVQRAASQTGLAKGELGSPSRLSVSIRLNQRGFFRRLAGQAIGSLSRFDRLLLHYRTVSVVQLSMSVGLPASGTLVWSSLARRGLAWPLRIRCIQRRWGNRVAPDINWYDSPALQKRTSMFRHVNDALIKSRARRRGAQSEVDGEGDIQTCLLPRRRRK